jgi:hypothetical protein
VLTYTPFLSKEFEEVTQHKPIQDTNPSGSSLQRPMRPATTLFVLLGATALLSIAAAVRVAAFGAEVWGTGGGG